MVDPATPQGLSEELPNPAADPEQVARTILLRRLDAAPRTRAQLADTLRSRNVPDDVANRVLDRFEEVGLINDRVFAQMWVESRTRTRNLSARALRRELQLKRVADHLIAEAVQMVTPEDEVAGARRIVARKVNSVAGLPRATQYRRLAGALARKGYGGAVAAAVVREALAAAVDEAAELGDAERAESLDSGDLP